VKSTKNIRPTTGIAACVLVTMALTGTLSGCVQTTGQREDAVTDTARRTAVLSLHQRTLLNGTCRYGLTLTNNLNVEIRDLTLRFTAYDSADTRLQSVTRGFFGVKPTLRQFTQINFAFDCNRIKRIQVGGFGRCMVGELTLRSATPGACLNLVVIAESPFVELTKAENQ